MARSKYGNRRTMVDGIEFASAKEARRYMDLRLLEKARLIEDLQMQRRYRLEVNGYLICSYVCDFSYWDNASRRLVTEDTKGFRTPAYRLKKKLMKAIYGIDIQEI
jgi:hypothetical protein